MFVCTLCKVQTVTFEKLANAFDSQAQAASSLRRIQHFVARHVLDSDLIAKLIFGLLPNKEELKLSIDRINWKFGQTNFKICFPHKNKEIKVAWLFNSLKTREFLHYARIVRMGTQLCYVSGCKVNCKDKDSYFLIIVSFNKPEQAQINYSHR